MKNWTKTNTFEEEMEDTSADYQLCTVFHDQVHLTRIPEQDINKALAYGCPAWGFSGLWPHYGPCSYTCWHSSHTCMIRSHSHFTACFYPGPGDNNQLFLVQPACCSTKNTHTAHLNTSVQLCTFQESPLNVPWLEGEHN